MQQSTRCFKSLEAAGYLQLRQHLGQPDIELLAHGQAYASQLQKQWLNLRNLAVNLGKLEKSEDEAASSRLSFIQSQQFNKHLQQLQEQSPRKAKIPTLLKHQQCITSGSVDSSKLYSYKAPITQLITDFFVEPHRGLEHFYNMQRESKIWWMRYSSNPSRYSIEPYDLKAELADSKDYQSIDIKSALGIGQLTVEKLTLAPLPESKDFELPDARTGKTIVPAVIRSVIELEPATCALLLDGCDHGRDTHSLLLNRVLAPYQCAVACLPAEQHLEDDMRDLQAHFVHELQRAGLRLCPESTQQGNQTATDTLGVPYTLLLDAQTLQNGLLQLRSRDTKLMETIHISDIPDYLLNIFRN